MFVPASDCGIDHLIGVFEGGPLLTIRIWNFRVALPFPQQNHFAAGPGGQCEQGGALPFVHREYDIGAFHERSFYLAGKVGFPAESVLGKNRLGQWIDRAARHSRQSRRLDHDFPVLGQLVAQYGLSHRAAADVAHAHDQHAICHGRNWVWRRGELRLII